MFKSVRHGLSGASFVLFICATAASASAQESKFQRLARPQFTSLERIDGISADGSRVIATFTKNPEGVSRPLTWDAAGTPKLLGLLPDPGYAGPFVAATFRQPISADGSLIGGYCQTNVNYSGIYGSPPVTWDAGGSIRQLPSPSFEDGFQSGFVSAVSPNGAYLYGWCQVPPTGYWRPFRWTADGEATQLQTLSESLQMPSERDGESAWPMAATSTDGTIAVGSDYVFSGDGRGSYRPVRYRADGAVETLPLLGTDADGRANGQAELCSGDGSVVVGWLEKYSRAGAFIANVNVCWPGGGRVIELPIGHTAMTPDGRTIVGSARLRLVDGQIVATKLDDNNGELNVTANDVSDDGRVMVGVGSKRVDDYPVYFAVVWIHNRMYKLEDLLASRGVSIPKEWQSDNRMINFCSADGTTLVGEGKFGTERTAFRVTIPDILVDRKAPEFETLAPIRRFCDSGKTFATVTLPTPRATDNFPGKVVVTTTAGPRFPIGTTNVVWTAKDVKGNVARRGQKVIVTNRLPTARAGRDIVVTTRSERGARVNLNGSASTDPDEHALKFKWTAKRVTLAGATSAKASGLFPVGATVATLTVSDAGGGKDADAVRVTVRLRNARQRPRGSQANDAFAHAARSAGSAVNADGAQSLTALSYAGVAASLGDATGEYVRWEEGQSPADAHLSYAELRSLQHSYGSAAAHALLSAYAETGDENLIAAYGHAVYGAVYAAADLTDE